MQEHAVNWSKIDIHIYIVGVEREAKEKTNL